MKFLVSFKTDEPHMAYEDSSIDASDIDGAITEFLRVTKGIMVKEFTVFECVKKVRYEVDHVQEIRKASK